MQAIVNILNSLVGFFLAVLIVVIAAVIAGYTAIQIQKFSSTTFYTIDSQNLKKNDVANSNAFQTIQNQE